VREKSRKRGRRGREKEGRERGCIEKGREEKGGEEEAEGKREEEKKESNKERGKLTFHCSLSCSARAWCHFSLPPGQRRRWVHPKAVLGQLYPPCSLSGHLQTCAEGRQLGLSAE